jgi:protein-serine/threonine kinase
VKQHRWFANLKWGLLRNETPPIRPTVHKDGIGLNIRHIKESVSLDIETGNSRVPPDAHVHGHSNRGRSRKDLPPGAGWGHGSGPDPFSGFESVTLHYDGED